MPPSDRPKENKTEPVERVTPIGLPSPRLLQRSSVRTPSLASAHDTYIELADEITLEHHLRIQKVAVQFKRLLDAAPEIHTEIFSDAGLRSKMLTVAAMVLEGKEILASLELCASGSMDSPNLAQMSAHLEALCQEIRIESARLEPMIDRVGEEENLVLPELATAGRLAQKNGPDFEMLAFTDAARMAEDTRCTVESCLRSIRVGLDHALTYAMQKTGLFLKELEMLKAVYEETRQNPAVFQALVKKYQALKETYELCLDYALKLIERMPQKTLEELLGQLNKNQLTQPAGELKDERMAKAVLRLTERIKK